MKSQEFRVVRSPMLVMVICGDLSEWTRCESRGSILKPSSFPNRRDLLAALAVAGALSLLPVDVCANNIVALSQMAGSAGATFHLTADHYYTLQDACQAISKAHGYAFEYIGLEAFIAHMNAHCTKHDLLYPLMAFFNQNFRRILAMREKRYDNRQYRDARARATATLPEPPLDAVVSGIVEFLQTEHLVPPAPARSVGAI